MATTVKSRASGEIEYEVRTYNTDGRAMPARTYFTTDRQDAVQTHDHIVGAIEIETKAMHDRCTCGHERQHHPQRLNRRCSHATSKGVARVAGRPTRLVDCPCIAFVAAPSVSADMTTPGTHPHTITLKKPYTSPTLREIFPKVSK